MTDIEYPHTYSGVVKSIVRDDSVDVVEGLIVSTNFSDNERIELRGSLASRERARKQGSWPR